MQTALYLIPVPLGETSLSRVLPAENSNIITNISHYIVENVRTARRFLKKTVPEIDIDALTFFVLNQHTSVEELSGFLKPLSQGFSVGVISEAGCPAIADPGADIVAIAQQKGYKVVPLVGPSSILLSLMASGFNGQSFSFLGYLPIDQAERVKKLKQMEHRISVEKQTQIFIETPYRNTKLVEEIIRNCRPNLKLCIACNITCEDECIQTKTLSEWKKGIPDVHKKPTIFLLFE